MWTSLFFFSQVRGQRPGLGCLVPCLPDQLFSPTPVWNTIFPSLFSNWVLDPFQVYQIGLFTQVAGCCPLGPLKLGKKNKEKIGIQHLSLFSLILSIILSKPKFAPRSNHIEEYFQTVYKPRVNSLLIRSWNSWQRDRCWNAFKLGGKPA